MSSLSSAGHEPGYWPPGGLACHGAPRGGEGSDGLGTDDGHHFVAASTSRPKKKSPSGLAFRPTAHPAQEAPSSASPNIYCPSDPHEACLVLQGYKNTYPYPYTHHPVKTMNSLAEIKKKERPYESPPLRASIARQASKQSPVNARFDRNAVDMHSPTACSSNSRRIRKEKRGKKTQMLAPCRIKDKKTRRQKYRV